VIVGSGDCRKFFPVSLWIIAAARRSTLWGHSLEHVDHPRKEPAMSVSSRFTCPRAAAWAAAIAFAAIVTHAGPIQAQCNRGGGMPSGGMPGGGMAVPTMAGATTGGAAMGGGMMNVAPMIQMGQAAGQMQAEMQMRTFQAEMARRAMIRQRIAMIRQMQSAQLARARQVRTAESDSRERRPRGPRGHVDLVLN
jgi:hypothetical protein